MRALFATFVIAACTPDDRLATTGQRIVGGAPEVTDRATVLIGGGGGWSTGTLISPRVVLTCGHCVDPAGLPRKFVWFGNAYPDNGLFISIASYYPHPDYLPNNFRNADVGIVVLETAANVAPIAISDAPLDDAHIGTDLELVGFGGTNAATPPLLKMSKTTPITGVLAKELTVGQAICGGDSGGPGLIDPGNGTTAIAGVISWYTGSCTGTGGLARVDLYAEWIRAQIAAVEPSDPDGVPPDAGSTPDADESDPSETGSHGGCNVGAGQPAWFVLVALVLLRSRRKPAARRQCQLPHAGV